MRAPDTCRELQTADRLKWTKNHSRKGGGTDVK